MSSVQLIALIALLAGLAAAQTSPPTEKIGAHVCKGGAGERFFDGHVLITFVELIL